MTSLRSTALGLAMLVASLATPGAAFGQDARAYQRAAELLQRGATAEDVVRELAGAFSLNAAAAAKVLGAERVEPPATARAVSSHYRLDAKQLAAELRRADYAAEDIGRGLRGVTRSSGEAVDAMRLADMDPAALRNVILILFSSTPEEYVESMKAAGEPVVPVATTLKTTFGLAALDGAKALAVRKVSTFSPATEPYLPREVAEALRVVWELDVVAAYKVFFDHPLVFPELWSALEAGGYEVGSPPIVRYRIPDYRPGHSGHLEDLGIVNPSSVGPMAPDPSDGEVAVLVPYRDMDGIVARMAGVVGEIVGREPHEFLYDGATTAGEWLRIRFHDFGSGSLMLTRLGRTSSQPALALGYRRFEADLIEGPIRALQVAIGAPKGQGRVTIPAGTYGGVPVAGSTVDFEVSTHRQGGIEADLMDINSNSVTVQSSTLGVGMVRVDIEIRFEEAGAEVEGTFLEYIPCWSCGTFEVPKTACSGLDLTCFSNALGAALMSLGTCVYPANWVESEMAAGPAVPFQADLTAPTLTMSTQIGAQNGAFLVAPFTSQFSAGISLRTGPANVPLGPLLQSWILGEVNARLAETIEEAELAGTLRASLEQLRATYNLGTVRGLYLTQAGDWVVDHSQ
jgi:hypothetical protein